MPTVRSGPGDTTIILDAVSGTYRQERRGRSDSFWFAHRRPHDWAVLDQERRNGILFLGERPDGIGHLIVDGAVAVEHPQEGPGYRRIAAMVEEGFLIWTEEPLEVQRYVREGRATERLRWEIDDRWVEAEYDVVSWLCVATSTPIEVDEMSGLVFDGEVDADVFTPPEPTAGGWRGGPAYVVELADDRGRYVASWEPSSGPGSMHIPGPFAADFDEAIAWAQERTDDVWTRDVDEEHRRV